MSVLDSRYPPEIRDIVLETGEQHCMWWSAVDAPGKKPGLGQASAEMSNAVVGSDIEATQGTTSAQPISANSGYSFEGDDELALSGVTQTPTSITAAFYAKETPANSSTNDLLRNSGSGGEFRIFPRDQDSPETISGFVEDSGGNTASASATVSPTASFFAIAMTASVDRGRVYMTAKGAGAEDTSTGTGLTGANLSMSPNITIGSAGGSSYWQGPIGEVLYLTGADPTNGDLDRLLDRIWWRHQ